MMDATDMESLTTPLQVQAPESPSDDPSDNPINTDISPEESSQNQTRMPGPSVSTQKHKALVGAFVAFTLIVGYTAATQPSGAGWRFFSWHPFLMVSGFIGMMGSSAITKKLGGYTNTKVSRMILIFLQFVYSIGFAHKVLKTSLFQSSLVASWNDGLWWTNDGFW